MSTVIGILLLVTFFAFIIYAVRGGNLMLGLFVMAVLWSVLGFIGGVIDWTTINTTIFNDGPVGFGSTAIYIVFGSWFGRVMVETGIAGTIIRKATELGGDKPGLTCGLLCAVVALIFTTAYGPGAVVSIGVIVFPIMLSLGISKVLSTASFCMSVGCGLYFNQSLLNQAAGTMVLADGSQFLSTAEEWSQWYGFAAPAFVIHFISIIVMIVIAMHFGKKAHAWAAPAGGAATGKDVNIIACLTPIIPVVLSVTLGFQMIPGIVVAVLWALIFTGSLAQGWSKVCELVQKTFHDGVADVGLVLGFLVFLQMFVKAAGACQDLLAPIVAPILPTDPFALFIVFGVLGFLALYRGPLTIWGAGVATFAIVAASTNLPLAVLYPLFYIPCCTVNTNVCPTQSWNMWAIGYTKISVGDFMKQAVPFALVCNLVLEVLAYFMFAA